MNEEQLDLGASFAPRSSGEASIRAAGRIAVCDLVPGTGVDGVYLLSSKETRQTRQGKPFFKLRVSDRTGTVDCTVWEVDSVGPGVKVGDLVTVCARVTEYQGKPQLEATSVIAAPPGVAQPRDFLPSTYRDIEELQGVPAVPYRVGVRP